MRPASVHVLCCSFFLLSGGVSGCVGADVECSADGDCGGESPFCLIEENRCVECLDAAACDVEGAEGRCLDWTCFPEVAPDFSLVDMNPHSSTFEGTITLSEHYGEVVFVFFAGLG